MPLVIVGIGIVALLVLIMGLKLNTFVSLIIVSFGVALLLGMPLDQIVKTIEAGIGGTLGHLALIFGLGAMLGKLIADAGGAANRHDACRPIRGKEHPVGSRRRFVHHRDRPLLRSRTRFVDSNCLCDFTSTSCLDSISRDPDGRCPIRHARLLTTSPGSDRHRWGV